MLRRGGVGLLCFSLLGGLIVGTVRLNESVERRLVERVQRAGITFLDLPDQLRSLAQSSLYDATSDLLDGNWLDSMRCQDIAQRVATVGWVKQVDSVRRAADARFEVSARYRVPVAMIQQQGQFLLIDAEGVRLPGTYRFDPHWPLVQGVRGPVPAVGGRWESADIAAGLTVIESVISEPFVGQITAVLVDNFGGRTDPKGSHLQLSTDRAGGRILWGSAPGFEVEENTVSQKLAILRANFQQTGRVDAHYPVIDVSTFPDRFVVPG